MKEIKTNGKIYPKFSLHNYFWIIYLIMGIGSIIIYPFSRTIEAKIDIIYIMIMLLFIRITGLIYFKKK
jgi:hypothetical protein